jgi:hypothetical protein
MVDYWGAWRGHGMNVQNQYGFGVVVLWRFRGIPERLDYPPAATQ